MSAIIFDCDGVLADTERDGHLPAFNQTFQHFGLPVQWSQADYAEKLAIGGGKERMASLLTPELIAAAKLPTNPDEQQQLIAQWHRYKSAVYQDMVQSGRLPARPGIARLTNEAIASGWTLVVASTSAESSVRAVLEYVVGQEQAAQFHIFAGDIVSHKKPAPDIYLLAKERLNLSTQNTLVIEDSRQGLVAAIAAGFRTLVTVSSYTAQEDLHEAILVVSDLGEPNSPMRILANRSLAKPKDYITLQDIQDCLLTE
ncbi:HAD-IA family hydrolase [Microcoleus sp. FACHB-1515]|uniref:HAD-IA family hydrolase n=1 Tax=Cyanophyceae TaxID=3028117 RepID=UPI00168203ED|nr:HAD-IA family hydrolase [Microcoleus sp. FACHB-1515]MBD2088816.1 HAD-IA family hydrolase [Microcoleus sp. FACHB-1515]